LGRNLEELESREYLYLNENVLDLRVRQRAGNLDARYIGLPPSGKPSSVSLLLPQRGETAVGRIMRGDVVIETV
jgi:hypothetical protein